MKLFLKKITLYLSLFLGIALFIYFNSKHNLISDKPAKKFVQAFSRHDLIIKEEPAEDRRTCLQLISYHQNKHFNHLFIGSSRIMQLGKNTGFQNSLNLGVSAAGLDDLLSVLDLIEKYNISVDTISVDLNPWTVCKTQEIRSNQFHFEHNLKEAFNDVFTFNFKPNDLFSIFQPNKMYRLASKTDLQNPNHFIRFTDGSIKHKVLGPLMKAGRVDYLCNDLYLMKSFYQINTSMFNQFNNKISDLAKKHHVIVFLSPFHPKLFEVKKDDIRVRNLQILEALLFAKKAKNIEVVASFNPNQLQLTDDNFIDGIHINEKTATQLFRNKIYHHF